HSELHQGEDGKPRTRSCGEVRRARAKLGRQCRCQNRKKRAVELRKDIGDRERGDPCHRWRFPPLWTSLSLGGKSGRTCLTQTGGAGIVPGPWQWVVQRRRNRCRNGQALALDPFYVSPKRRRI